MTIEERVALCREYAKEAAMMAQAAPLNKKLQYRVISAQWHHLAAELEHLGPSESPLPARLGATP